MQQKKCDESMADLLESLGPDYSQFVELGQRIGEENLNAVLEVFGSQKPHIPTRDNFWSSLKRAERNNHIRQEFNGTNYADLAAKYSGYRGLGDLCERHVRDIVHQPAKEYRRAQASMKPVKASCDVYAEIADLAGRHCVPMHRILEDGWRFLLANQGNAFRAHLKSRFGEQQGLDMDDAA